MQHPIDAKLALIYLESVQNLYISIFVSLIKHLCALTQLTDDSSRKVVINYD